MLKGTGLYKETNSIRAFNKYPLSKTGENEEHHCLDFVKNSI